MLCPEVWNFKAPESTFKALQINPDHCGHSINKFVYNHLVSVVLPDTVRTPENLSELLTSDCDYYKIEDLSPSELISQTFLNNFVKSGSLYLLSINSRIDCDNCIAITPKGQLILSVTKETYQKLGLEGPVSHFEAKTKNRFVVRIDLKANHFKPGKPNYERTKRSLSQLQKFTVILTWSPPRQEVCPSSIAQYFNGLGYSTHLCPIKYNTHTTYSVKAPAFAECDYSDFVEWLGMIAIKGDFENCGPESYLSSYETPNINNEVGQVKFMQWRGFFTADQIAKFSQELWKYRERNEREWVAMYVQGFSDSPIAWGEDEHHFFTNGDNGYVLIGNKENVACCKQRVSRKQYCNQIK